MLADPLVERRLPWHKLEADAIIEHGKTPAGEVDAALERSADCVATIKVRFILIAAL
jgi:hypothetical protein